MVSYFHYEISIKYAMSIIRMQNGLPPERKKLHVCVALYTVVGVLIKARLLLDLEKRIMKIKVLNYKKSRCLITNNGT